MLNRIQTGLAIIAIAGLLAACGGADGLPAADIVSTLAAQTAEVALTQTMLAGVAVDTVTPLPVPTDTPEPEPTEDTAIVPTNSMSVDATAEDGATAEATTATTDATATTEAATGPTATTGSTTNTSLCDWKAAYEGETPPYDGSTYVVEKEVEKTWYVKNISKDGNGNGCAWARSGVVLRWAGTYKSDKPVVWSTLSQADKETMRFASDFGNNLTAFIEDAPIAYQTKATITLNLKMPNKPGYYLVEWLIFGPDGDPIYVDGGALWWEVKIIGQGG